MVKAAVRLLQMCSTSIETDVLAMPCTKEIGQKKTAPKGGRGIHFVLASVLRKERIHLIQILLLSRGIEE
ncbi:MAG: hypothetical protein V7642_4156 [Burkholderiales bacterium]|jgi:hypothetical protein